jgi:hypothetical protein
LIRDVPFKRVYPILNGGEPAPPFIAGQRRIDMGAGAHQPQARLLIAALTVSGHALRASRLHDAETLRHE